MKVNLTYSIPEEQDKLSNALIADKMNFIIREFSDQVNSLKYINKNETFLNKDNISLQILFEKWAELLCTLK